MHDYSQVHTQIWGDEKFKAFGDDGQLLFLYLLTSPHSNMVGYYRLPLGYVVEDKGWPLEKVTECIQRLAPAVEYDPAAAVVLVRKFMLYNPVKGPSQEVGAERQAKAVPKSRLWDAFLEVARRYAPGLADRLDAPATPSREGIGTVKERPARSAGAPAALEPATDATRGEAAPDDQGYWSGLMAVLGDCDIDMDIDQLRPMVERMQQRGMPLAVAEIAAQLTKDLCGEPRARGDYYAKVIADWLTRGTLNVPAAEASAEKAREKAANTGGERRGKR